jgi:hypothetical protein
MADQGSEEILSPLNCVKLVQSFNDNELETDVLVFDKESRG